MIPDLPPSPNIHVWPLPYEERLAERPASQIDLVVIHCTELPDLAMARQFGERTLYDSGAGNSGHYYIDRDGSIELFVRPTRVANHTRGYNPRSVGIELVNTGRYPNWLDADHQSMSEPYTEAQIRALLFLLQSIKRELPKLTFIAGHEDLDSTKVPATDDPAREVYRKRDPGPHFPWQQVIELSGLQRLHP